MLRSLTSGTILLGLSVLLAAKETRRPPPARVRCDVDLDVDASRPRDPQKRWLPPGGCRQVVAVQRRPSASHLCPDFLGELLGELPLGGGDVGGDDACGQTSVLDLSRVILYPMCLPAILAILTGARCTNLTDIRLGSPLGSGAIDDAAALVIAQAVEKNPRLGTLGLMSTTLSDLGIANVSLILKDHPSLRSLLFPSAPAFGLEAVEVLLGANTPNATAIVVSFGLGPHMTPGEAVELKRLYQDHFSGQAGACRAPLLTPITGGGGGIVGDGGSGGGGHDRGGLGSGGTGRIGGDAAAGRASVRLGAATAKRSSKASAYHQAFGIKARRSASAAARNITHRQLSQSKALPNTSGHHFTPALGAEGVESVGWALTATAGPPNRRRRRVSLADSGAGGSVHGRGGLLVGGTGDAGDVDACKVCEFLASLGLTAGRSGRECALLAERWVLAHTSTQPPPPPPPPSPPPAAVRSGDEESWSDATPWSDALLRVLNADPVGRLAFARRRRASRETAAAAHAAAGKAAEKMRASAPLSHSSSNALASRDGDNPRADAVAVSVAGLPEIPPSNRSHRHHRHRDMKAATFQSMASAHGASAREALDGNRLSAAIVRPLGLDELCFPFSLAPHDHVERSAFFFPHPSRDGVPGRCADETGAGQRLSALLAGLASASPPGPRPAPGGVMGGGNTPGGRCVKEKMLRTVRPPSAGFGALLASFVKPLAFAVEHGLGFWSPTLGACVGFTKNNSYADDPLFRLGGAGAQARCPTAVRNSWRCWFEPLSACEVEPPGKGFAPPKEVGVHEFRGYGSQVLEGFDARTGLPRSVPAEFRSMGRFRFVAQLLGFLVANPNPYLRRALASAKASAGFGRLSAGGQPPKPYLSMHVRHGDSCIASYAEKSHRVCEPLAAYMAVAVPMMERYSLDTIYLATDDEAVVNATAAWPKYTWLALPSSLARRGGVKDGTLWDLLLREHGALDNFMEGQVTLIDVLLMAEGGAFVGKFTSNIDRVAFGLMASRKGGLAPYASLDSTWCMDWGVEAGSSMHGNFQC